MKLQSSRSRDEPEINVISLVDVLLVLVLFFMVSTTFLRETELFSLGHQPGFFYVWHSMGLASSVALS